MIRAVVCAAPMPLIERLRDLVGQGLEVDDLRKLHEHRSYDRFRRENDQSTVWHERFYDRVVPTEAWRAAYDALVHEVVVPLFGERLVYQAVPTFRVHLPGNVAVGELHTDADYGHGPDEVNVWVPLTDAAGSATIRVARRPGRDAADTCAPIDVDLGQIVVFDAVNYLHGNDVNDGPESRVSFDLRVVPAAIYADSDAVTVNTRRRLVLGEYFALSR